MINKFFQTIITLGKVVFKSRYFNSLEKLPFDEVIVLANGPSLARDIENNKAVFEHSQLAVVNSFCQSDYFFQLKPKNYFLLDPFFFFDSGRIESVEKTIEIFLNKIDWEIDLHIPYKNRNSLFISELKKRTNFKIHLINYIPAKGGFRFINHWLYDLNLATPQCQNVVAFTTFVLVRRKPKKIFLFGAENDWHAQIKVNKENWLILNDDHVYEKSEEKKAIVLTDYKDKTKKVTMVDLLGSSIKVFKGYTEIERYAQKKHVKVYNCSKNSMIDAFERLDDDEFTKIMLQ
ncbi:hypothetical protein D3C71_693700 [compost metagenome]